VLQKKEVGELVRTEQPPCACAMANCVHMAHGGWAMASEEGGRGRQGKRGLKQTGQALLGGQVGHDARVSTQCPQPVEAGDPPPPPNHPQHPA
jgi:hypothetical protein